MFKKLQLLALAVFLPICAFAQSGSVTGNVTDATTGETIPGATVQILELSQATAANADGEYILRDVQSGTYTLRVTTIGYKANEQSITVGSGELIVDVELAQDVFGLDDVVVTGVGSGTQTKKLGFSVAKVSSEQLSEVPAADVGSAIRAKVPGVTVVSASGDPSSAASIRLRGSTSISGGQDPLIIIDGIITDGSLADINMQDVESIEIVKGAAGASLYGSLAGNGVIQIITKRASKSIDKPQFTVRSEYGFSEIAKKYPLATTHPWVEDATLTTDGKYVDTWGGYEQFDSERVWNNPYPVNYDNVDAIFTGQAYNTNYVSVSNAAGAFNYFASFENFGQKGVIEGFDSYDRNSIRFNSDYLYNEKFKLAFSGSYINTDYPGVNEQGQGSNFFYSALTVPPIIDFNQRNANGNYTNNSLTGYDIIGSNFQNPLYVGQEQVRDRVRERFIMGLTASYQVTDWLSVDGRQSFDKRYQTNESFNPVGYQTPNPSTSLNNGFEGRTIFDNSTSISELWATGRFEVEDLNVRVIAKYLYEDRTAESYGFSGFRYSVAGIRDFGSLDQSTYSISNNLEEQRAENFILDTEFDYDDKLIVGAMVRRDGSSGFGADERYQVYYRGSLAYRLSEDIEIDNVQELKLRASYGTSGQRPPFEAQYETYSAGSTVLIPNVLGNSEIKPSVIAETEFGVDVAFLDRFNLTVNYALANVTNDYLVVPLTSDNPFSSQFQNVGEIENTAFEVALQGQLLNTRDMQAGLNLSFSKIGQEITDLGEAPAFTRSIGAVNLFRFEEGVPYGSMYGNKLISSVNDLTVDGNGFVVNAGGGTLTPDDFSVNSLGHVVVTSDAGTEDERPMYLVDELGNKETVQIGNTNPDFQIGLSGNFSYKNLNLFMVWDWSQGGEVYNYTKQLLTFNYRHKELETLTRAGFDPDYLIQSSGLYNGSEGSSHYVEDGSFVKLREVSLSYTISNSTLGNIGNYIRDIKLAVTGRNLLTFTDYTGYDPEVALRTNSTNFKLDEYSYPNFRTFTSSIQVRF